MQVMVHVEFLLQLLKGNRMLQAAPKKQVWRVYQLLVIVEDKRGGEINQNPHE